jgi:hypothetical protein
MSNIQKLELTKHTERVRDWKTKTEGVIQSVNEVWENKMWHPIYDSFKDWLEIGCGVTKQWGYEILKTAKTRQLLSEGDGVNRVDSGLPHLQVLTKEETAQISPSVRKVLDGVPFASQVEAVREAASTGKVTPKKVEKVIEQAAAKIHDADLVLTDETELARTVPAEIAADWQRAEATAKDILHKLRDALHTIDEGLKAEDSIFADTTNGELSPLKAVIGHVNLHVKPHAVCAICHGLKSRKSCKLCKGRGYIGRHLWQTCVDSDTKALIAKMGGAK